MNLPVKIVKMEAKKPLTLPKKASVPTTLSTQLTKSENAVLQKKIKDYTADLQRKIDERYPDDYNKTTLMDDSITQMKNEILRKIKFYKHKEISLPNFIRKTREELLEQRRKHVQVQEEQQAQAEAEAMKKEKKLSKDTRAGKNGKGQADSQSHFASQIGGTRSRGKAALAVGQSSMTTHQESNATLNQASDGDDLNSITSGVTGSRPALNINIQSAGLNKQHSNAASSSHRRPRKASKMPQTHPASTKAARAGERPQNNLGNGAVPPSAETKSEMEQQQKKDQFVDYCTDLLVPKQKRKENIFSDQSAAGAEIESVEKTAKFVQENVKKTLYGEAKYNKMRDKNQQMQQQAQLEARREQQAQDQDA